MRIWPRLLAVLAVAFAAAAMPARAGDASARARALLADAQRRIARGSHEQRQFARSELEDAQKLAPADDDVALTLGQLEYEADMLREARLAVGGVLARDSANAAAHALLGLTWRRTWLVDLDLEARDRAIVSLARAARLAPRAWELWQPLIPILVDEDEPAEAHELAMMALHAAPSEPRVQILAAMTAQQTGDLDLAARLFATAIPRLPAPWRERYDDLQPLIPAWRVETWRELSRAQRAREALAYWRAADPDPVTPENEAKLEFDARVTMGWLLYGMLDDESWDMRAQLIIRYGKPQLKSAIRSATGRPRSTARGRCGRTRSWVCACG